MGHWTWRAWFICYYSENITKFYLPLQPQPARPGRRDLVRDRSEIYLSSESREAANCRLIEREKYNGNTFLFINPTPDPLWGQQSLRGLTQLYTFIRHQSLFWRRVHSTRAWSLQTWGKHLLCSHIHCTPARHRRACDQRWWGFIIVGGHGGNSHSICTLHYRVKSCHHSGRSIKCLKTMAR